MFSRTDIGIRLLNANENVVFRLKKERYKKAVLKCLRRSLSQQFAVSYHYEGIMRALFGVHTSKYKFSNGLCVPLAQIIIKNECI